MAFPRFVAVRQSFPDRGIADIGNHVQARLQESAIASRLPRGARIAIGVGSRGIANIATITRAAVDFWKSAGARPFLFPAMGSHGAATAEGQSDVLAHYGIHEATMGVPVISALDVISLGKTPEGIETFMDRAAFEADGVFLIGRVKWHTDFEGAIESGLLKMMAIGLGKFAGAQQYHTFGYKLGLEPVIRAVGRKIFSSGKFLGGLAILEGAHHETAALEVVIGGQGFDAMVTHEEALLAEVKAWRAQLPAREIDVLIVDEIGKNISGAGMDTKVINRSVVGHYNAFPDLPVVHRVYARRLSSLTYGSGIGVGLADVVHSKLLESIDWRPTYVNSLTASTPANVRSPIHFATDLQCLETLSRVVGKLEGSDVTYCWIRNTLELIDLFVSENMVPELTTNAKPVGEPFALPFDAHGNLTEPRLAPTVDSAPLAHVQPTA